MLSESAVAPPVEEASGAPLAAHAAAAALLDHLQPKNLAASFDLALSKVWLAYQPIVRADDGTVFGYEALLRSTEPSMPTPGLILEAAERLKRTEDLGRIVRSRAPLPFCDAPETAVLFVNLHPKELLDPLLYLPTTTLSRFAKRTVLEITERATIRDLSELGARVSRLRALGFRIAVDDLGAGYSGLTSFADLMPEFVKLDLSLTRDIDRDPLRQRIVRSMASLCKDVGARVVAEGIERREERDAVAELGCDYVQGFFVARPDRPFPARSW